MAAPVQPLPEWMSRTYLPDPDAPNGSRLAAIVFPQTYSGPYIGPLDYPWTSAGDNRDAQVTLVSIIGEEGQEAFTQLGVEEPQTTITTAPSASSRPSSRTASQATGSPSSSAAIPSTTSSPSPTRSDITATNSASRTTASSDAASSASSSVSSTSSLSAPVTSDPTLSTANSFPTSSPASTAAVIDPSQYTRADGLSRGVIAAIVLFSVAVLLAFILLLMALFRQRRRKRASMHAGTADEENGAGPEMQSRGGLVFTTANGSPEEREGLMHPSHGRRREGGEAIESLNPAFDGHDAMYASRGRHVSAATGSSDPSAASTGDGSTNTRGSLIAQFPTWGRKPSDDSTNGGPSGNGTGTGNGTTGGSASGSGGTGFATNDRSHSPATMASSEFLYSPYSRAAAGSKTNVVAGAQADLLGAAAIGKSQHNSTLASESALGLGRPSHLARERDLPTLPAADKASEGGNTRPAHASYPEPRAPHSTLEAPTAQARSISDSGAASTGGWLGSFGFLRPYLGGTLPIPYFSTPERRQASGSAGPEVAAETERQTLLPSAIPLNRKDPSYRRVTTTAAAYDTADLAELQRAQTQQKKRTSVVPGFGAVQEDSDEEDGVDEGKSLVGHNPEASSEAGSHEHEGVPPTALLKDGQRRASRTTLGRPIRRLSDYSGISQISLADARSISESIAGSIMAARSRSRSRSPPSSLSHKQRSTPSRSRSGSSASHLKATSDGSVPMSRKSSRRDGNSSQGSSASGHTRKSGRSEAQEEWDNLHQAGVNAMGRLRKVSEQGEIIGS